MDRLAFRQEDWRAQGACLHADPDVFFPISAAGASAPQIRMARAICSGCPVRGACTDFALDHQDVQGIWGGTTDDERRKLRRARARTPSRARPGRLAAGLDSAA